ncbi:SDR family NAD(P)-dependent oxidoreductase [Azospirillum sp. RWY-5-1]|uniref:SDR family NAD(P)-dependent oxidoreductase n=1 Tax=Azospirillum oleiclasticum TaxID=2735135 RepID=A0ABX2TET4_9PROT|nr:SDR family NAD(P)-dependent oxidoreductase [Azospirillum oleiclasticum]NYZ14897.1 SDR family NAD(P)-dependent oxidoreductase [Azospirillum oleiclasticum]NYZ22659.1 SDR family NAD(P)-dependent oxidoreductase [Azospirillum oleiclasticum]
MREPGSIVITGASSGIGESLARLYAARGIALALTGRDRDRLEAVAAACRGQGAAVTAAVIDVTDREGMAEWLLGVDQAAPVDLLIANAGVSAGTGRAGETEEQARFIFDVNLTGVLNSIHPLLPAMRQRRRGQIAIVSSLAGFRGMPGAPAYSASKAAVRVYGEALRGELAADGVEVSVVCPGFVRSRMTARNPFPMPFLMDGETAARIIRSRLARNRGRIAFPWPTAAAVWLLAALPPGLTDRLLRAAPKKP